MRVFPGNVQILSKCNYLILYNKTQNRGRKRSIQQLPPKCTTLGRLKDLKSEMKEKKIGVNHDCLYMIIERENLSPFHYENMKKKKHQLSYLYTVSPPASIACRLAQWLQGFGMAGADTAALMLLFLTAMCAMQMCVYNNEHV